MKKVAAYFSSGLLTGLALFALAPSVLAGGLFYVDSVTGYVGVGNTTPAAPLDVAGALYSRLVTATSTTINWNGGNVQSTTLTSNATLSFTNGQAGGEYTLIVNQDGTGGRVITWPSSVLWFGGYAPTLTAAANGTDMMKFVYNGSNYLGSYQLNATTTPASAIAFDSQAHANGSGTSCSFGINVGSAPHNVVIVNIQNRSTSDPVSAVTVGGVSGSLAAKNDTTANGTEMWDAVGVPTGSQTVSVTMSNSGGGFSCGAASYTGVNQTNPIDNTATSSVVSGSSPLNAAVAVGASNAWLVMTANGDYSLSAGSGTTLRISANNLLFDSNGTVGTGSQQLQATWSGSGNENAVIASLKPY